MPKRAVILVIGISSQPRDGRILRFPRHERVQRFSMIRAGSGLVLGLAFALAGILAIAGCRSDAHRSIPTSQPAPSRIISVAPDGTEMIACLGQTPRLVA